MVLEVVTVPNNVDAADEFEKTQGTDVSWFSFVFIKTLHF